MLGRIVVLSLCLGLSLAGTPVVLWHGMGDSCCLPTSMGHIQSLIENGTEPGTYVHSLKIGSNVIDDTINGFLKPVNDQVDEVCRYIAEDPELAEGYHAVGFSQGGQFLRAVAQRCPNPPMKNLITLGAQHQGVFGFPRCPGESIELCNIMRELLSYGAYNDYVQSVLVQAQYWHDPLHYETYVEKSQFIAEINNEGPVKNVSYAENLAKLETFVMVKFAEDKMVEPRASQHFEFYRPGSEVDILPLLESPLYTENWIGLQDLNERGDLVFLTIPEVDHMQIPTDWFMSNIVAQYLHGFKSNPPKLIETDPTMELRSDTFGAEPKCEI
eukprot:maker-scaffold150_size309978-snap-gene-2.11 protein:Tk09112 transcript:maker-scaffold150_size309978-snap-gene-2.11-mRNA-1 annotation:"hypothetical protein BRAFLDRAFT_128749"